MATAPATVGLAAPRGVWIECGEPGSSEWSSLRLGSDPAVAAATTAAHLGAGGETMKAGGSCPRARPQATASVAAHLGDGGKAAKADPPGPRMRPQVEDLWDREAFRSRVRAIAMKAAGRKITVPSRRKEDDLLLPEIAEFKRKAMEIVTAQPRMKQNRYKICPDREKIQKEEYEVVSKLPAWDRDQIKADDMENNQKAEGPVLQGTKLDHIKIDNSEGTQREEFDIWSDGLGNVQMHAIADLEYHPVKEELAFGLTLGTTDKIEYNSFHPENHVHENIKTELARLWGGQHMSVKFPSVHDAYQISIKEEPDPGGTPFDPGELILSVYTCGARSGSEIQNVDPAKRPEIASEKKKIQREDGSCADESATPSENGIKYIHRMTLTMLPKPPMVKILQEVLTTALEEVGETGEDVITVERDKMRHGLEVGGQEDSREGGENYVEEADSPGAAGQLTGAEERTCQEP